MRDPAGARDDEHSIAMNTKPFSANAEGKRILIIATTHWMSTARLAMALAELGCRVELMAPSAHPALATDAVSAHHRYWPMFPMSGLRRALGASRPDLLLLADELSFLLVEELAQWALATDSGEAEATLRLLRRSFGNLDCLPLTRSRKALLTAADTAGVSIPLTTALHAPEDLRRVAGEMPGPWMLKADSTWGGFGVRKVDSADRLTSTWKRLQQPLGMLQSIKRGFEGKEWGHLHLWLRGADREVIAQGFVEGIERTGMAVCAGGRVLAFACLQVEEVGYANGPASKLRVVTDGAMEDSMRRVAAAVGISGFCGFDFMLDAATGESYLLEMNMRPTQLAHLSLGPGRDLCATLVRELLGAAATMDRVSPVSNSLIATFPQHILNDPSGSRLAQAFHDVPWTAPQLVRRVAAPGALPSVVTSDPRWCVTVHARQTSAAANGPFPAKSIRPSVG